MAQSVPVTGKVGNENFNNEGVGKREIGIV
jgi:hypothetical protein